MSNTVKLKRSAVASKVPATTDLALGELALNTYDGNLFFKKSVSNVDAIVTVATVDGSQTLKNKTIQGGTSYDNPYFLQPVKDNTDWSIGIGTDGTNTFLHNRFWGGGDSHHGWRLLDSYSSTVPLSVDGLGYTSVEKIKVLGELRDHNLSAGSNGQVLTSTSTGVVWNTPSGGSLATLTDVALSTPTPNQVLTYTGSAWINADPNVVVASAVFATNAQTDMGSVTDLIIGIHEDLGFITDVAYQIYNMGQLKIDGIVSLSNIDQSVKADYIGYSIIFGF